MPILIPRALIPSQGEISIPRYLTIAAAPLCGISTFWQCIFGSVIVNDLLILFIADASHLFAAIDIPSALRYWVVISNGRCAASADDATSIKSSS